MTRWLSGYYEENIIQAAEVIKRDGLVAFPTETVYGLGANALSKIAVAKIFEVKNRPDFDPLIVHISKKEDIYLYAENINEDVEKLIQNFWPGPLTIVLPKKDIIPDIVTAGLRTVAIRMPSNSIALKLIDYAGVPIAAPSANPFGYISPTSAFQVAEMLNNKIDFILDGGKCQFGLESTVITFQDNEVFLLRPGALEIERIERVLNKTVKFLEEKKILSPGQLDKHYSPHKKMILIYPVLENEKINYTETVKKLEKVVENIGDYNQIFLILPSREFEVKKDKNFGRIEYLSDKMDYRVISSNLFEKLYLADKSEQGLIVVVGVVREGLGFSIMNRLQKAADEKY
ncbi:MAG: L-threonylcarbamoyladenylate synthase [bacterium]